MDENQINVVLNNVPGYLGTFALDELVNLKVRIFPSFLIINLDLRENSGTHWIAIAIYLNDVFICDSLGTLVPNNRFPVELINFLHIISYKKSIHITQQLQSDYSSLCGQYASYFINQMAKSNLYGKFLSNFSSNFILNDAVIEILYKSII